MRKPWTATIVLGFLGLVALPVLIGAPALIGDMRTEADLGPFVLFLRVLTFLCFGWLAAFVWVVFRHRGRTRTILLAGTATVLVAAFVLNQFAPRRTVSVSIDLPPANQPAER